VAKIFSRDEYLLALRGKDELKSLRGMSAEVNREAVHASSGKTLTTEDKTEGYCGSSRGDERSSLRRKAYRYLDAYAGQFY
jgi:hypothetical protein